MELRDFLEETKKPGKLEKAELLGIIIEYQDDLIDFYIKKAHQQKSAELFNKLFERLEHKKMIKAIKSGVKDGSISIGFVSVIAGLIEKLTRSEDAEEHAEVVAQYTEIATKLLKKRINKLSKSLELEPEVLLELLFVVPDKKYISDEKYIGIYSQKMLRKLYIYSANKDTGINDTTKIKKLFKKLLGENLLDVIAVNILLEKKEYIKNLNERQTAMWNLMTKFALETIEAQDKEHITELIEYYVRRRHNDFKKKRDAARRIQLTSVNAEDYPRLAKRVSKMSKDEEISKYL